MVKDGILALDQTDLGVVEGILVANTGTHTIFRFDTSNAVTQIYQQTGLTVFDVVSHQVVIPAPIFCNVSKFLQDVTLSTGEYQTQEAIITGGFTEIDAGEDVKFSVGDRVELLPAFNVPLGASFEIEIMPHDCPVDP